MDNVAAVRLAVEPKTSILSGGLMDDTAEIEKTLKFIASADPFASPYLALQLTEGKIAFYRSSRFGFVRSKNYSPGDPEVYVSLKHFQDCLKHMPEQVEITVTPKGVVRLYAAGGGQFATTMFVHTVQKSATGLLEHTPGELSVELPGDTFSGFNLHGVQGIEGHPVVRAGRVMVATMCGVVYWTSPQPQSLELMQGNSSAGKNYISPYTPFLRLVAGKPAQQDLGLTQRGYFKVSTGELEVFSHGYIDRGVLFDSLNVPATPLCVVAAEPLLQAFESAAGLAGDSGYIDLDGERGIVVRDPSSGSPAYWTPAQTVLPRFRFKGANAKLIVNILRQSTHPEITIADVQPALSPVYRFTRGEFDVNVRPTL